MAKKTTNGAGAKVVDIRTRKRKPEAPAPKREEPAKVKAPAKEPALDYVPEIVDASTLKPHPENYKTHPEDQLEHTAASILQFGYYKNIVIARDGTILAGHGVWEAATKKLGHTKIPVRRMDLDAFSPAALKLVALDNELGKFAESDDRKLTEMLKKIREEDPKGLVGTGYDDKMLAALLLNTRHSHEIADINTAAEWVGMPDYDAEGDGPPIKLIIAFPTHEERSVFVRKFKLQMDSAKEGSIVWGTRWPWTEREELSSVRFEAGSPS